MTNHERRVQGLAQAVPARSGWETWRILCEIAGKMGYRFAMRYPSASAITEEIRRVVPMYKSVRIGSADAEGLWEAALSPLAAVESDPQGQQAIRPVRTLGLDDLETRFDRWFRKIFVEAREARDAQTNALAVVPSEDRPVPATR